VRRICCYPRLSGFLEAVSSLILDALPLFQNPPRLLFCAHGLPQRVIEKGDVYVSHVQQSVQGVLENLNKKNKNHLDWRLCYQSRVGPLEWTKPYVEETLKEAAADQRSVLLIPIAFVSEHSETLVELDITYKNLAKEMGILEYHRVPTVSCHPAFIKGLADLVQQSEQAEDGCENTLMADRCVRCGKKI
jgi:ferrochelatase